ncbi:cytochrome b/b6 domain-containing protein [Denitratisoma oestradiolicum]|uniref:Cytochrome B n=1 Tax=Denitratisoma oestradiolicum TaxID=311182 RepID=A0A6S6YQI4_9PROT|nr:cytochrome b/b6 domain-containing protein [Denitratisoma oestradiolicum]TWO80121.1 cytochrome B [Denitratisoma oestradiolicum]CAB1370042.1 Cytochrome B [Denitratisoma oestradiolicum]
MPRVKIWDLPTRVFHWMLFILVVAAVVTENLGGNAMEWHGRIGLAILGLVSFRISWGFVGSTYARFGHFLRGPRTLRAYLRGEWQGLGHNPLGAWAVLALLLLLLTQALTGLFANDDIAFNGPLYDLVGKALSDRLRGLHAISAYLLMSLVSLHILAILYYRKVKRQNLVTPMLTGWIEAEGEPSRGGGIVAFIVSTLIAILVVYAASGALLPPPPPTAAPAAW